MEIWGQILLVTIPALIVLFVAYFLIKFHFDALQKKEVEPAMRMENPGTAQFINYQAYERLVLYLERINPSNMVLRMHKAGMSAKMLEADMVKSIRTEYEHNLSQQIYFSDEIWKLISTAKEETIQIIGLGSKKVSEKASAVELSKILIKLSSQVEELPHDVAIKYLKQELREKAITNS